MFVLAPSILAADFGILSEELKTIEKAGAQYVHIDVMDGHFVSNISLGIPVIKSIRKNSDLFFDVHLMISNPEIYVEKFIEAGADLVNFHFEAAEKPVELLRKIRAMGVKNGITVNPETEIDKLFPIIADGDADMVLIMSVNPGFGGQPFIENSLKKARILRKFIKDNSLSVDIEMDGGITLGNAEEVIESGVNVIVAGSSVFGAEDKAAAVKGFLEIFDSVSSR